MSLFSTILVPLDGSRMAARALGCATWLAERLEARLHILSATSRELPAREELERLQVPERYWPLVTLEQALAYPDAAILSAVKDHGVELVVMSALGAAAEGITSEDEQTPKSVGHVTRAVVERCAVPVLLLPPGYREALPWKRAVVPVSGGVEADEALALSVRLANALSLYIHVAHVTDSAPGDDDLAARARYADSLHHEYSSQLEELVRRALPQYTPEECRPIESIALSRGDIGGELRALIEREEASVVAVGWHGNFMSGHAEVLKHLIRVITSPVLLVKSASPPPFRLKVGEELG